MDEDFEKIKKPELICEKLLILKKHMIILIYEIEQRNSSG